MKKYIFIENLNSKKALKYIYNLQNYKFAYKSFENLKKINLDEISKLLESINPNQNDIIKKIKILAAIIKNYPDLKEDEFENFMFLLNKININIDAIYNSINQFGFKTTHKAIALIATSQYAPEEDINKTLSQNNILNQATSYFKKIIKK